MSECPQETCLLGRSASRGLALAPLTLQPSTTIPTRIAGAPAQEHAALTAAIEQAGRELEALVEAVDETAGEILEFQLALLDDDDLTGPILARVKEGAAADEAWHEALDAEISVYREGDDEVFAARAADLEDLRDRVLRALARCTDEAEPPLHEGTAILAIEDLTPSRFLEIDWRRFRGAVLKRGSVAGHVALLARARGVPLLVDLGSSFDELRDGALTLLDAENGRVIVDPNPDTVSAAEARLAEHATVSARMIELQAKPARTANGERVFVSVNVDDPALLDTVDPTHADGIGLTRTEFLFQGDRLPDEERQLAAYARVLNWAGGRPVVIRTLDAGGDKPITGLTPEGERNPFLGLRGLRLSLARPDVFRIQLRALARVAVLGPLKVMVPMVGTPDEFEAFCQLFETVLEELATAGIAAARPALGMMVEVPAAALNIATFSAEFVSIGSNDLIQYVMAASRDEPAVAHLYRPCDPAVLELIRRVVEVGVAQGKEVSLCGEMASEAALVPILLEAGLRRLSVTPAAIGPVKAAIAHWPASESVSGHDGVAAGPSTASA